MKQEPLSSKESLYPDWLNAIPDEVQVSASTAGTLDIFARKNIPEGTRFGPCVPDYNSSNTCEVSRSESHITEIKINNELSNL